MAFSADGKLIAAAANDTTGAGVATVRVWDLRGDQLLSECRGAGLGVGALAFSPDGRRLVTGGITSSQQGILKLWDTAAGREVFSAQFPMAMITAVAFSTDGRRLAAAVTPIDLSKLVKDVARAKSMSGMRRRSPTTRQNNLLFSIELILIYKENCREDRTQNDRHNVDFGSCGMFCDVRAGPPIRMRPEPSALKLVPEDALAVVVFNRLDKVDEQIGKLAKETQFPAPTLLPMIKMVTGIQEGLDEHGSAALALMPAEEADAAPIAVIFIPVSDYKKFIGQLKPDDASAEIAEVTICGMAHAIAHKGDFAVVVGKQNKDTLKKVLSSSKNIVPVIGSLGDWVANETISFVAMPTGVKRGIGVARKAIGKSRTYSPIE